MGKVILLNFKTVTFLLAVNIYNLYGTHVKGKVNVKNNVYEV